MYFFAASNSIYLLAGVSTSVGVVYSEPFSSSIPSVLPPIICLNHGLANSSSDDYSAAVNPDDTEQFYILFPLIALC